MDACRERCQYNSVQIRALGQEEHHYWNGVNYSSTPSFNDGKLLAFTSTHMYPHFLYRISDRHLGLKVPRLSEFCVLEVSLDILRLGFLKLPTNTNSRNLAVTFMLISAITTWS